MLTRRSLGWLAGAAVLAACSSPKAEGARSPITSLDDLASKSDTVTMGEFTSFETVPYSPAPGVEGSLVVGRFRVARSSPRLGDQISIVWQEELAEQRPGFDKITPGVTFVVFSKVNLEADRDDLPGMGDLYTPTGLTTGIFAVDGDQATQVGADFDSAEGQGTTPAPARTGRTFPVEELFSVELGQR